LTKNPFDAGDHDSMAGGSIGSSPASIASPALVESVIRPSASMSSDTAPSGEGI
jgi:hypothetical protein